MRHSRILSLIPELLSHYSNGLSLRAQNWMLHACCCGEVLVVLVVVLVVAVVAAVVVVVVSRLKVILFVDED